MLNCILGMVDKTKRALSILQRRNIPTSTSPNSNSKVSQGNHNNYMGHGSGMSANGNNGSQQSSGVNTGRPGYNSIASTIEGLVAGGGQYGSQFSSDGGVEALIRSKLPVSDMLAATLRSTEDRVVEVRRRAEEAVLEVIVLCRLESLTICNPY